MLDSCDNSEPLFKDVTLADIMKVQDEGTSPSISHGKRLELFHHSNGILLANTLN